MPAKTITLPVGSPSRRLAKFFKDNPDEMLDRRGVAIKLGITQAGVDTAVQDAITAAVVTVGHDAEFGRVWRAGPMLKHWVPGPDQERRAAADANWVAPAPAQSAAPPATPEAAPERRERPTTRGPKLPRLDPAGVTVKPIADAPLVDLRLQKGATKYDAIFDKLTADDLCIVGLPRLYMRAMQKAAIVYRRERPAMAKSRLVFRQQDDDTFGVWRIKA